MRDNADLQDRTQQLEHLILQLQSETDTIGKKILFILFEISICFS
jgi:hypothetical protein